jgi:predicted Zn-dependent peptidase
MEWDWNEVDGVTTLSAPAGAIQGPLHACLVFGVGRADETMPVAGITHVVEHLALQPFGHRPYSLNGSVDSVSARFMVNGSPDDVVEFLGEVTRNLADLPIDGLELELQILQVEERRHTGSQIGADLSHRLGPRGAGLIGWPEHGLKRVGPDEVTEWARTWFTADNAVLWTSAPIPDKIDLKALPQGSAPEHVPAPASRPPARTFRSVPTNLVSVTAIMEQLVGLSHLLYVAQRRAFDRIRRRDALAYAISTERVRIDGRHSLVYLGADGTDGSYTRVFEGLVEIWDELADTGPTEAEWDEMLQTYEGQRHHPQSRLGNLDNDAEREVLGLPYVSDDEYTALVAELTPEAVRDNLAAISSTLGAVVPAEVEDGAAGWKSWAPWSKDAVGGSAHQPIDGREEGTLVLGDDGVSWISEEDKIRTVRWSDAVCAFTWDDGRRTVLAPNGEWVSLIPWCWRGGGEFTQRVDDAIDPGRRIRLGEGDTHYLRDENDPKSSTDVRWLGTVVGARYRGAGVDLVIDTDGFFLLFSRQTDATVPERLAHLRVSDRLTLLGTDPRNRWIAYGQIEQVELTKNVRARLRGARRILLVQLRDGTSLDVELQTTDQVEIVSRQFTTMLGPIFRA